MLLLMMMIETTADDADADNGENGADANVDLQGQH